ncbi:TIM-barrel domain-containing protein [Streptomyces sp. NPDC059373]
MSDLHPRTHRPFVAPCPPLTPAGPDALDPLTTASVTRSGPDGVEMDVRTAVGRAGTLRLRPAGEAVVRVTLRMAEVPATSRVRTAGARTEGAAGTFAVAHAEGAVVLELPGARLRVTLEPPVLELTDRRGRVLRQARDVTDSSGAVTVLPLGVTELADGRLAYHDSWSVEPDEHFYGLGERFTGLDLRGQRVDCWVQDSMGSTGTRSYKASPFLISSQGYAVLVDTTAAASFDLAHSNTAAWSVTVPDEVLDYYLITGSPAECVTAYRDLTGPALLPPKWAFGPWISGGFRLETDSGVRERARRIREHRFPCDVLHIDTYWQPHGGWSDMRWDTEAFPDPRGMVGELAGQGFRTSLWMNSYIGVGSPYYDEVEKNGWFLRTGAGDTWVGQLWGGHHPDTALLDLTHPGAVAWFKERIRGAMAGSGAAVLKTDFGEAIPADAVAHNGMTGERLHNLYPLLFNDIAAEVTREVTGGPGLTWGRSSWTGGQRHGAKWTGDPDSTWTDLASTLRAGLSLGLTGHPFWSHDIGGFHGTPPPELFARWAQFGLLSPLSRFHGMTSRLPWDFGDEAHAAVLHAARLRMTLLPYLYSAAAEAVRTGEPLARPMCLDFPDRPDAHGADLQYLLCPDLLIAPFYAEGGRRPVWFPPGEWLPYAGGAAVTGPAWRDVQLPLATAPLWIRAGALLLTTAPADRAGDDRFGAVTALWARPRDTARTVLHDVGGARTVVMATRDGDRLRLQTEPEGPGPGPRIAVLDFPGDPLSALDQL